MRSDRQNTPHPVQHRIAFVLLVALCLIIGSLAVVAFWGVGDERPPATSIGWGVSFSQKESTALGLDWRENYSAILTELEPECVRVAVYWDLVEPEQGRYDFDDLDWQVAQAEKAGIPLVLAIGQKVPRWPEFHCPAWLDDADPNAREAVLEDYLAAVVMRYRGSGAVRYWQVENEPFLSHGVGTMTSREALAREVALVRRLDPSHPVLQTDSGEMGAWWRAASHGDVLGTTLYRRTYNALTHETSVPLTPGFYRFKASLTRWLLGRPDMRIICAELGAEPWGDRSVAAMSMDEQARLFSASDFDHVVSFARATGFDSFYLWGAEWWYWREVHGDSSYWNAAKSVIASGRAPALP
jgi:hypothetical protein